MGTIHESAQVAVNPATIRREISMDIITKGERVEHLSAAALRELHPEIVAELVRGTRQSVSEMGRATITETMTADEAREALKRRVAELEAKEEEEDEEREKGSASEMKFEPGFEDEFVSVTKVDERRAVSEMKKKPAIRLTLPADSPEARR
jgi:hypothetical protein